jgi:methylenetetrahydrofolate dehydrogenase (NADP+) / methenyltetrahydrofolate cyclohydrolase
MILDGSLLSSEIKNKVKDEIKLNDYNVGLGIILVGSRSDSLIYVNMKKRVCNNVGINNYDVCMDMDSTTEEIINEVEMMNDNDNIHGILIQLPLPPHVDSQRILSSVKYAKDVDGFHAFSMGMLTLNKYDDYKVPCTAKGIMKLFDKYQINLKGKDVVIVGKSDIVGMPVALLCLHRDATVTVCHEDTSDLDSHTKKADIIISATGVVNLINATNIKKNAIIIDVGINKIPCDTNPKGYKIVGDCDYDNIVNICHSISPVPGGVGPMTIAVLMENVLHAYKFQTTCRK